MFKMIAPKNFAVILLSVLLAAAVPAVARRDVSFLPGCVTTEPSFDPKDAAHSPGDLYLFQECFRTAYNAVFSKVGPHYYTISSVDFWDEDEVDQFIQAIKDEEGEEARRLRGGNQDEDDDHSTEKQRTLGRRSRKRGAIGAGGKCNKLCRDRDMPLPSDEGHARTLVADTSDVSAQFTQCVRLEQNAGFLLAYEIPLEGIALEKCGE